MIRLRTEDCNTPEWFNNVWKLEGIHGFDRVRMQQFLESPDVVAGDRVLDVGAGWMGVAQYAVANGYPGNYTAIDFSEEAKRRTFESLGPDTHLAYDIGNALALPYPDGFFDRVCCGELIEHFSEPDMLVKELVRVCRAGGRVIISTVDADCEDAIKHGDYPEHLVKWDSHEELAELFKPYGDARSWIIGDYFMAECVKGKS